MRTTDKIAGAMGRGGPKPSSTLTGLRSYVTLIGAVLITLIAAGGVVSASPPSTPAPYTFNFEGNPATPQPWNPSTWDVAVHSRDTDTFAKLEGMEAQHGADCSAPPATHPNSSYEGAVFLCRNHVMTAISAGGYGEIVLTPDHMVDLSEGPAQVLFSVSTYRASLRDWYDVWLTPFGDNLVLPIATGFDGVDLQGPPKNAIHINLANFNGASTFNFEEYWNFQPTPIEGNWWTSIESLLSPSAATRTQFEIDVSLTHLRFGIPSLPSGKAFWFVDADFHSKLKSSQYVVQIAHHSYNPTKDCAEGTPQCLPDTWHWSNVSISKAVPFTLLRGDSPVVHSRTAAVVNFPAPAPDGAFLRFAGIGSIEVSSNGGKTWQAASRQAQSLNVREHFSSYWTPVPAGTKRVMIRGKDWYAGPWWVRDVAIWSTQAGVIDLRATPPAAVQQVSPPSIAPGRSLLIAGGLLGLAILAAGAYVFWRRRSRSRSSEADA
jgi:hypothetical protein